MNIDNAPKPAVDPTAKTEPLPTMVYEESRVGGWALTALTVLVIGQSVALVLLGGMVLL